MGVRRCLARSLTSLAFRCALQRVQTVPAAIHSGRIPPHNNLKPGTEDSAKTSPHRTWSVPDASSPISVKFNFSLFRELSACFSHMINQ